MDVTDGVTDLEAWAERAAILEHDAGLSRPLAEVLAAERHPAGRPFIGRPPELVRELIERG